MNRDTFVNKHLFKVIVLIAIFTGFFIINSYLSNKNSIARESLAQQSVEKDRQFDAQQKESCLDIYKQESDNWSNVSGWRYDDFSDTCYVEYRENPKKTKAQCDVNYKDEDGKVSLSFFRDWTLCYDGLFQKSF